MLEISCLPEGDIIERLKAEIDRLTAEKEKAEKELKEYKVFLRINPRYIKRLFNED